MPITVQRRCPNCHEMKPSGDFPVLHEGQDPRTKLLHKDRSPFCRACLIANPRLASYDRRDDRIVDR